MVTKGYRKGVYDRLPWALGASLLGPYRNHVGTAALCPASVARRFHDQSSTPWWKVPLRAVRLCARSSCEQKYGQQEQQGLRSLRRIFQTMMLIDLILRE